MKHSSQPSPSGGKVRACNNAFVPYGIPMATLYESNSQGPNILLQDVTPITSTPLGGSSVGGNQQQRPEKVKREGEHSQGF